MPPIPRPRPQPPADADDATLFFDESVPVPTSVVSAPAPQGLAPEDAAVIGEQLASRLAQRPGR